VNLASKPRSCLDTDAVTTLIMKCMSLCMRQDQSVNLMSLLVLLQFTRRQVQLKLSYIFKIQQAPVLEMYPKTVSAPAGIHFSLTNNKAHINQEQDPSS